MIVLVTGISGLDRLKVWGNLENSKGEVTDLGNLMLDIAKERYLGLDEHNILRAGLNTLAALRAAAIARFNSKCAKNTNKDQAKILSAHSVFSRNDGLLEGIQPADLEEISPDIWITLIDGPQVIEERLKFHKAEYFPRNIWEIVKWQELEVFFSNHLATINKIRHYVVPINQPEVFSALISGDKRQTAYASYPMSHAPEKVKKKIRKFIKRLKKEYILFDPGAIESSHGFKEHHTKRDKEAIGSHTIVRDLDWFIRINADSVIAYWPDVIFSSGMSDELRFAYEIGRKTILVTEKKKEGGLPLLSPFLTYKASIFWSSDDYFQFLNLPIFEQELFMICQEVMVEKFRLHDSGAEELTKDLFINECDRLAGYQFQKKDKLELREKMPKIAAMLYKSWKPLLDMASRKGKPKYD